MAKRKKKRRLDMQSSSGLMAVDNKAAAVSIVEIFGKHQVFIGVLILILTVVYANSFPGDFSIVDDLPAIVNSDKYADFWINFRSLHIQQIIFSSLVNLFGYNPLPFHVVAVSLHLVNVVMGFFLLYWLFGERVAKIGSLIFAVHPVNTEAVTWISGMPYLVNGIFFLPSIMAYVKFKKTGDRKYFWWSLGFFTVLLASTRTPSVLTLPMALVVMDQLILEKRINWKSLLNFSWFAIPTIVYVLTFLRGATSARLAARESGSYLNQQQMSPVLESWPYTISKMLELYAWPKKLMIYYDGNELPAWQYWVMVGVALLFVGLVVYLWRRKREVAGLVLLPVVLLAPTMSPIKVTWFMAERYLYLGSLFYGAIVGIFVLSIKYKVSGISRKWNIEVTGVKKLHNVESQTADVRSQKFDWLVYGLVAVMVIALSIRTVYRNNDYLDNKQFARVTIEDAPLSVRPYNDLGSLYLMDDEEEMALEYYRQALDLNPLSRTAINNIGLIYIKNGEVDYSAPSFNLSETDQNNPESLMKKALYSFQNETFTNAAYYVGESLKFDPENQEAFELIGDIFVKFEAWGVAGKYYLMSLDLDNQQSEVYNKLSFVEAKLGNWELAKEYAEKTLELNPEHEGALQNLVILKEKLD